MKRVSYSGLLFISVGSLITESARGHLMEVYMMEQSIAPADLQKEKKI